MAVEILIAVAGKIGELLVDPIGRQFGYLIQRKKNIENLKHQLNKLEDQKNGVQQSIDVSIRNGEVILDEVSNWIKRVDECMMKAAMFLEDINENKWCFNGKIPNLITLYRLGKEAKEITMKVIESQEDGRKFNKLSNPAPSLGIESMSSRDFVAYEATKLVMMKVWEALKDKNINLIGIHGMGGVGKTTMATEIGKRAKEDKLFDEVLMVVVSQTPDWKTIQDQLADKLGLIFWEQSDRGRADRLQVRLQGVKRILIVLDDVWKGFDISMLGIQVGGDDRDYKIVITTRRAQVCHDMSLGMGTLATKIVNLECLSEQDSWDLFKRNAGGAIDTPTLNSVAKEICRKCQGLPLALVTVGRTMKDKELEEWKEAAQELKKSVPTNIEGVDEHIFSCFKFSYDYLGNEEAKSCFLLCSMFPEDSNIPTEYLVRYGVGLDIFKDIDTIQDARRRANLVINNLKASSLLLASEKEGHAKMHDVVRMAAKYIGSDKYYVRADGEFKGWPIMESNVYTGVSLMGGNSRLLPPGKFPNLQILLLEGYVISKRTLLIHNDISFFKGMEALKVLHLQGHRTSQYISFHDMYNNLRCLRTLILENMSMLDIEFLGLIKTLEVLRLNNCRLFVKSTESWLLTNLRLLDLKSCFPSDIFSKLRTIPNFLEHLSQVEELYLDHHIEPWTITILNSLHHLTVLAISIYDIQIIPEGFVFPHLEKFYFNISWATRDRYFDYHSTSDHLTLNTLILQGLEGHRVPWFRWFKMLLKRTQVIKFTGLGELKNIIPNLSHDGDGLNSLKDLLVCNCSELEYLIDTEAWGASSSHDHLQVLTDLENLQLKNLSTFKGLCNVALPSIYGGFLSKLKWLMVEDCNQLSNFFNLSSRLVHLHNLRVVEIYLCDKLRCIFRLSVARSLQQLEKLQVCGCNTMEEIVGKEEEEEEIVDNKIVFNSLKTLELVYLPNLNGFCTGSFIFEWPSLEQVFVYECPKMKTFAATSSTSGLQSTPKLKAINLDDVERMLQGVDLNTIIGNHSKEKEEHSTTSKAGPS